MTPICDIAMTNTVTLGIQAGKSLSCFNNKTHESKDFNKKINRASRLFLRCKKTRKTTMKTIGLVGGMSENTDKSRSERSGGWGRFFAHLHKYHAQGCP